MVGTDRLQEGDQRQGQGQDRRGSCSLAIGRIATIGNLPGLLDILDLDCCRASCTGQQLENPSSDPIKQIDLIRQLN